MNAESRSTALEEQLAAAVILPYQKEAKYISLQELRSQWENLSNGHCKKSKH